MADTYKPLAIVTGASSGIGYELAKLCAQEGGPRAARERVNDAIKNKRN